MLRALLLLLCALPAWAAPFATADVSDPRATHCDYEDTTTGETARVPVVGGVCRFDVSHWSPGSAHAARMRAVVATVGETSAWTSATLDRPAAATPTVALVPGVSQPSLPDPSPTMTAVRSAGTSLSAGTRTTSTLAAPADIVNGDKLLAIISIGSDVSGSSVPSITPPAGFVELTEIATAMLLTDPGQYGVTIRAFEKVASGESGSYAFTHASSYTEGFMYALSGAGTVRIGTVATGTAYSGGGGSMIVTANGVTTATDGSLVIFLVQAWDGVTPTAQPTGTTPTFTERFEQSVMYVADGVLATAGATGDKAITSGYSGTSNLWSALLIEVQSAGGGGSIKSWTPQMQGGMRSLTGGMQ